ncbi:MAG TPA: ABC transporter ATP-binding protein, partial [Clostridia bacterium]
MLNFKLLSFIKIDQGFFKNVLPRLLSFAKPWRRTYFASLIAIGVLQAAFSISIAYIFNAMTDFTIKRDMNVLLHTVLVISVVVLLTVILLPVVAYINYAGIKKMAAKVRISIYEQISSLPLKYFEKNHSGDLFSIITNDLLLVEQIYSGVAQTLINNAIMIAGTLVVMAVLDFRLTLILVILSISNIIIGVKYAKKIRILSDSIQKNLGTVTGRFSDVLSGLFTIKIFRMETLANKRFNEYNNIVRDLNVERTKKIAAMDAANYFIGCFNFGGIITAGALMIANHMIDFQSLATMVYLQINVNMTISSTSVVISALQKALAGADRVFALLDEKTEDEIYKIDKENCKAIDKSKQPAGNKEIIRVDNLSFGYDEDARVLNSLNMSVQEGKVSAIVGLSGCGKSTILKILQGFYTNFEGRITILGKELFEYSLGELRDMIAYVHQEALLFSGSIE